MKNSRQLKILEIISEKEIETQEEMAVELRNAGFDVTQSTVSRDIKELGLKKTPAKQKRQKYVHIAGMGGLPRNRSSGYGDSALMGGGIEAILSVEQSDNIIVIKTMSGMAMAIATAIDGMETEGILGCVAGDDTIMCVIKNANMGEHIKQILLGAFKPRNL